jgi:hypothetical protein
MYQYSTERIHAWGKEIALFRIVYDSFVKNFRFWIYLNYLYILGFLCSTLAKI